MRLMSMSSWLNLWGRLVFLAHKIFMHSSFVGAFMSVIRLGLLIMLLSMLLACQSDEPETSAERQSEPVTSNSQAETNTGDPDNIPDGQLPRDVLPERYALRLRIDPAVESFSGTAKIDLNFTTAKDLFWLHGNGLSVSSAKVVFQGRETIELEYTQVHDSGVARLDAAQRIPAGNAVLEIDFNGPYNHSLEGLYRVDAGEESYAFTQFEASSARLSFPGFDDPWFKVPFDVTLEVKETDVAIANTPDVETTSMDDGWKSVRFATSKPLPTYLVAFAVGPFDVVAWDDLPPTSVRSRPLPLRGIAVKGKGEQLTYALKNSQPIVESLENYFGIPYPYAKLDIIAVPDFSAGAMENAGAITYREQLLLLDENSTAQIKFAYQSVHAHELAHQWFGNLVTPNWWDDIWLNEAFATWMAAVALDRLDDNGGYRRTLLRRSLGAMNVDSLVSARQIRQPILSNHDIASAFDAITYSKGGGVLAMFERFLGRENFRRGIQSYLQKHSWDNAGADDFISAISSQAPEGQTEATAAAFQSFLTQPGLPLLEVGLACEGDAVVNIKQRRYFPLGSKGDVAQQWKIPACIRYGKADGTSDTQCALLDGVETRLSLETDQCPTWVLPNAEGAGYYRYTLDTVGWTQLLTSVEQLSDMEMLSITDSYLAAYRAGQLDLNALFEQLPAFINHSNYEVASSVLADIQEIYEEFADSRTQAVMREQLVPLYQGRLAQLGMDSLEDRNAANLQTALVRQLALVFGSPEMRSALGPLAMAYTGTPTLDAVLEDDEVNANLLQTAMSVAVVDHGKFYFDHLITLASESEDATFRQRVLSAIGRVEDEALVADVLELSLSSDIRNNETGLIWFSIMTRVNTRQQGWTWLQNNLDAVLERVPLWRKGRVAAFASGFCDTDVLPEVEAFFGDKVQDLQGGPRALDNTIERVELCVARKEHYTPQLVDWAQ